MRHEVLAVHTYIIVLVYFCNHGFPWYLCNIFKMWLNSQPCQIPVGMSLIMLVYEWNMNLFLLVLNFLFWSSSYHCVWDKKGFHMYSPAYMSPSQCKQFHKLFSIFSTDEISITRKNWRMKKKNVEKKTTSWSLTISQGNHTSIKL